MRAPTTLSDELTEIISKDLPFFSISCYSGPAGLSMGSTGCGITGHSSASCWQILCCGLGISVLGTHWWVDVQTGSTFCWLSLILFDPSGRGQVSVVTVQVQKYYEIRAISSAQGNVDCFLLLCLSSIHLASAFSCLSLSLLSFSGLTEFSPSKQAVQLAGKRHKGQVAQLGESLGLSLLLTRPFLSLSSCERKTRIILCYLFSRTSP